MGYAVNEIAEVKVFAWNSTVRQIGINITHWLAQSSPGTGASDQQMADFCATTLAAAYKAAMSADWQFWGCSSRRLTASPPVSPATSDNSRGPGTFGMNAAPTQVSGILKISTGFSGRAFRGRIYIPGIDTAAIDAHGEVTPGYGIVLAGIAGLYNLPFLVNAGPNQTNFVLGIYHRLSRTITPASVTTRELRFATQRRRGDFGRLNVVPFP
jgi:hypothetical protein